MLRFFIIPLVIGTLLFSQTGLGQALRRDSGQASQPEEILLLSRLRDLTLTGYTGGFILDPNDPKSKYLVRQLFLSLDNEFKNDSVFRYNFLKYLEYAGNALAKKQNLNQDQKLALARIKELIETGNIRGTGSLGRKILFSIIFPLGIIHKSQDYSVKFLDQSMKGIEIPDMSGRLFTLSDLERIKNLINGIECPVNDAGGKLFQLEDIETLKRAFEQFNLDREKYETNPKKYNEEYLNVLWQNFRDSSQIVLLFKEFFSNNENIKKFKSEELYLREGYVMALENLLKHSTEYVLFYGKSRNPTTEEYNKMLKGLQENESILRINKERLETLKRGL